MDKTIRNELLINLADINELISDLQQDRGISVSKEKAAEAVTQLLHAYSIKTNILVALNNT